MSAVANEEYEKRRERKQLLRQLENLYSEREKMTDTDIFSDKNIVEFEDVIKLTTGQKISSYTAFKRSHESRERIAAQTEHLADLLESEDIQARIDDDNKLFMKTHITRQLIEIPKYRNINFLPSVAQRNRRDMLKDFEYFMTTDRRMKNARYFVITAGPRVPFDGRKNSLKNAISTFKNRLQRWRNEICSEHDIEVVFQGIEFTRDDDATYHVHANVVIVPYDDMLHSDYNAFYIATQEFLPHFEDCGKIQFLKEFVKYPFKPADLHNITSEETAFLYYNTFNVRLFEALGSFKEFCKTRKEQKLRIVRINNNLHLRTSASLLVEKKKVKDEDEKPRRDALKNHVLGVMTPGFYATPWKESATLIVNFDADDQSTTNREFAPDDLHKHLSMNAWENSDAPAPNDALAIAKYIINASDDELEMIDERSNVHSHTITSNSQIRQENDLIEHDPDPPDLTSEALNSFEIEQQTPKILTASKEDQESCAIDFLAIFDEEPEIKHTEQFHFRNEIVDREDLEECLNDLS